jgi:hypothetical protein
MSATPPGQPPVASTPFGKRKLYEIKQPATPISKRPKMRPGSTRAQFYAKLWHLRPLGGEAAAHGFGITIPSYGERLMTIHLYQRNSATSALYIDTINCIPRVNNLVLNGIPQNNDAGYAIKILMFHCEHDVTREQLEDWFNNVFVGAFMNANPMYDGPPPSIDPNDGYQVLPNWYSVLDNVDLTWCLQHLHGPLGPYFRASKTHLYSAWSVGHVPVHLMVQYGLNATHLHSSDEVQMANNDIRRGVQAAFDLGVSRTTTASLQETGTLHFDVVAQGVVPAQRGTLDTDDYQSATAEDDGKDDNSVS